MTFEELYGRLTEKYDTFFLVEEQYNIPYGIIFEPDTVNVETFAIQAVDNENYADLYIKPGAEVKNPYFCAGNLVFTVFDDWTEKDVTLWLEARIQPEIDLT